MANAALVHSLSHLRRRAESYLGRRLPLPRLSPRDPLPAFDAQASGELKSIYRGRCAEIFFNNDGPVIWKWLHYLAIYDKILVPFVGSKVKMLEIGVYKGGSLSLWRKYLGKDATLFGIDIDPSCAVHDGKFGNVRIGSQDDPSFLRKVITEMGGVDIVLDDGSHIGRHQRTSFEILFPLLNEGGLYVIEDMHTAYWPRFEGGLRKKGTAIEFLKDEIDKMHQHYFKDGLHNQPTTEIDSIQFFDSIAVVSKGKQHRRFSVKVPSESEA
jgi:hypothetical protein